MSEEVKTPLEGQHDAVATLEADKTMPEPEIIRADGDPSIRPWRLLAIHAHPDDETSKGGGSTGRYAEAGVGTTLICCTGGEAGSVLNPALNRPEIKARIPELRRAELAAATAHLGYHRVWMLGYRDSNMPASGDPDSFAAAPLEEAVRALIRLIRQERPHVVITYPDNQRGYQHPDHIRVHDASVPAYHAAGNPAFHPELGDPWTPQKLYYTQWSRARLVARHQAFLDQGLESPFKADRWQRRASMDHRLTTKIFVGDHWDRVQAALRAYETQIDPNSKHWFGLPPEVDRAAYPYDDYILAHSSVPTRLPEDDLFSGVVADDG